MNGSGDRLDFVRWSDDRLDGVSVWDGYHGEQQTARTAEQRGWRFARRE